MKLNFKKYVARPMTKKHKEYFYNLLKKRTCYVVAIEPPSVCLRQNITLSIKLKEEDLQPFMSWSIE